MEKELGTCDDCKINYPGNLVQPMHGLVDGKIVSKLICGICYLEFANKTHKTNETKLDGPLAERLRQAAIKYRKEIGYEG